MNPANLELRTDRSVPLEELVRLYRAVGWSAGQKPEALQQGLLGSHRVVTAWVGEQLVGLGSTLSDGHLVVYYSHLLVRPDYQGRGIGLKLMQMLMKQYQGFHQQVMIADGGAIRFFQRLGFRRAGKTEPMWIYDGQDH